MGDLARDTAVTPEGDGRYTAQVSRDWEIWGPMGGYVASIALRAAGAEARLGRPASFACSYLGVAAFDRVDLAVTTMRSGRNAEAFRVEMTQGDRRILDATVWTIGDVEGLEHDVARAPDVPGPDGLPGIEELLPEGAPPFPFWDNLSVRPLNFQVDWPPPGPLDPVWHQWLRFAGDGTFAEDPWVDAARAVVLVDLQSWPSCSAHHAWRWEAGRPTWMAPTIDLYVAFHRFVPGSAWLLADGHAPVAGEGLVGWTGRLWSEDRRLVASGGGQMLCRRVPGTG